MSSTRPIALLHRRRRAAAAEYRSCLMTRILLVLVAGFAASAQEEGRRDGLLRRYLNHILAEGADPAAPKWIHYPVVAYSPETSWELGVSSLLVYSTRGLRALDLLLTFGR